MHYYRWRRTGDPELVLVREPVRGEQHGRWKGDAVGYHGVHHRLRTTRGEAREHTCPCGNQAQEWAFDLPKGFSTDLSRYTARCASCHYEQDRVV